MQIIKFIRKLKNKNISVETKEKKIIKGQLKKIDKQMNLVVHIKENDISTDQLIPGTNIRYIVFDQNVSFP